MIASLDRWLMRPAPSTRLAAARILIGGFVVVYMLIITPEFHRVTTLGPSAFEPVGLAGLLDKPLTPVAIWLLFVVIVVSGVAFVTGAWFRWSGPLFGLTTLAWASYHSSWGQMLHFEHLFTLHLLVLGWSPAADAWSVDAARRGRPVGETEHTRYGWPLQLAAIMTALSYVIAGIAKLRIGGLAWLEPSTLRNHIAYSATRMDLLGGPMPPLARFVVDQSWLARPLAWGALFIEFAAPAALVGPRSRRLWIGSAMLMHLGTALTLAVWFPYQGLGFAFVCLVAPERPLARSAELFRRRFNPPPGHRVAPETARSPNLTV